MAAEAEHGEGDEWFEAVESECDSGNESDLGVGGLVESVGGSRNDVERISAADRVGTAFDDHSGNPLGRVRAHMGSAPAGASDCWRASNTRTARPRARLD